MSDKEENGSRASSVASRSLSPGEARSPEHKDSPMGSNKERSRSRSRSKKSAGGASRHSGPRSVSRSRSRSRGRDRWRYSRSRSRSRSPYYRRRRSSRYSRSRSRSRSAGYYDRKRGYYRSHSRSPMSSRRRHLGDRENPKQGKCLGVFGLSLYTQERDLREVFSRFGPIDEVQIVYDHQTGRSRGFAFVYMRNTEDACEARDKAPGMEIDGRKIRVDFSITKRAHTPTPGIYLGKPTSRGYGGYGGGGGGGGGSSSSRRSPSPYYRRGRYSRSRSRSYTPRRY